MKKTFSELVKLMEAELPKLVTPEMMAKSKQSQMIPKEGDKAYTKYRGEIEYGVLRHGKTMSKTNASGNLIFLLDISPKTYYGGGITVGYDEPIVWDDNKKMWYAPADHD